MPESFSWRAQVHTCSATSMHTHESHLFHVCHIFRQSRANDVGRSLHHHPRLQPHRAVRAHPARVTHPHVLPGDGLQRQRQSGILHFDQQIENLVVLRCEGFLSVGMNTSWLFSYSFYGTCRGKLVREARLLGGREGGVGVNLLQCFLGTLQRHHSEAIEFRLSVDDGGTRLL